MLSNASLHCQQKKPLLGWSADTRTCHWPVADSRKPKLQASSHKCAIKSLITQRLMLCHRDTPTFLQCSQKCNKTIHFNKCCTSTVPLFPSARLLAAALCFENAALGPVAILFFETTYKDAYGKGNGMSQASSRSCIIGRCCPELIQEAGEIVDASSPEHDADCWVGDVELVNGKGLLICHPASNEDGYVLVAKYAAAAVRRCIRLWVSTVS